jgi:uncharacterized protein (DUF305 family)
MKQRLILTIMVLALSGLVLAQGMGPGHQQHHGPDTEQTPGMPGTGMMQIDSEFDFLRHMIVHHQEAIASAEQLLEVAQREELRELAREVITTQTREVEMMRGWLEQWYPEEDHEVAYQPMMRDFAGMSPEEAERVFIEDMIMHHMMAVRDARQLFMRGLAAREEVAVLAREIITEQMREIQQLQGWLRDWYGVAATGMMPGMDMMDEGMSGMMDLGAMGQMMPGMMGMHAMMRQCMAMMMNKAGYHGMMHQEGMSGIGMMGPRHGLQSAPYGRKAAEALARAFLAGYAPEAQITGIQEPQILYRISFVDGETERAVLVDAVTGEVRLEQE